MILYKMIEFLPFSILNKQLQKKSFTTLKAKFETMCISNQYGHLGADKIRLHPQLLRNKIADIIQEEFAKEINRLVHEELRRCCEACQIDDPGEKLHKCKMMEEEEIWACYFEKAKARIDIERFWKRIRREVLRRLGLILVESWMNFMFHLLLMDETNAFLIYKNYERKRNTDRDEYQGLECYDHM